MDNERLNFIFGYQLLNNSFWMELFLYEKFKRTCFALKKNARAFPVPFDFFEIPLLT